MNKKQEDKNIDDNSYIELSSSGNLTVKYEIKLAIGAYSNVGCSAEYIDSTLQYECSDDIGKRAHYILKALQKAVILNLSNAGIDVIKFIKQNKNKS